MKEFVSSSGSKYYEPIEYVYDEKTKCMIPIKGKKINRYEMIQASKPSCDINYIIKRALAGDMSALNVRVPSYADISDMPDNLNDLHKLQFNSVESFNDLDPTIKNLFGNDVNNLMSSIEDGSYIEKINNYVSSITKKEEVKEEVKEGDK